jgi:hypothetical protein
MLLFTFYIKLILEFDSKRAIPTERFAIASLDEGKTVIPVWLDVIYQQLSSKLLG